MKLYKHITTYDYNKYCSNRITEPISFKEKKSIELIASIRYPNLLEFFNFMKNINMLVKN